MCGLCVENKKLNLVRVPSSCPRRVPVTHHPNFQPIPQLAIFHTMQVVRIVCIFPVGLAPTARCCHCQAVLTLWQRLTDAHVQFFPEEREGL